MSRPDLLPDAARECAWRLLWERLLRPLPDDDLDRESESRERDEDEAAAEDAAA